jgi:hypothetical protein
MGFLKISMSVHTRLAAEKHLADNHFLEAAANSEEFLKLRGRTRIPVVPKYNSHNNNSPTALKPREDG